jgi:geranylgeranylglycerol-phosphate geranylgeranyltransferase
MGRESALRITASLFFLVVLLSYVPFVFGWLGLEYLLLVCSMSAVVFFFTIRLSKSRTPEEGRFAMRGIYLSILLGMLVFLGSMFFA